MPGARGAAHDHTATSVPASDEDSGQPVFDPPPLIEPTDFFEIPREVAAPAQPPPRPSFLSRMAASAAAAKAQELQATSVEAEAPPELVDRPIPIAKVNAASEAFDQPTLAEPAAASLEAIPTPTPPTARTEQPTGTRSRFAIGAGIVAALAVLLILADFLGTGPFSRVRHYPVSAAPSDPASRVSYYRSGAQEGDADDELQLAILYAKGDGVPQDYATAASWFRAAANQGLPRAQYDLGVLYERGRGVQVDLTEAANWYLKAAQGGHPLAEYNLAVCYTKGQGIRKDLSEAALWYRRAAVQGVVQAMVNLGMVYEKGDGVAVSPVDAYAWYLAAGHRSNDAARQRADEMFANLPHLDQIRAEALASDVAASIHDPVPERGEAQAATPEAAGTTGK
jgi:hypothetical protein